MAMYKRRPITPTSRFRVTSDFSQISNDPPEKSLVISKKRIHGRNHNGRITVRRRGGGHKRHIRIIDFKRNKHDIPAKVAKIQYDPNRSARIALLHYIDGEKRYIIAPNGLKVGDTVLSGPSASVNVGNCLPIDNIPVGEVVHNIELRPGGGAKISRGAGSSAQIMGKDGKYAQLRLLSLIHI